MKNLVFILASLCASNAFAQNADHITQDISTNISSTQSALTTPTEEPLYIIHATQFTKEEGKTSNVKQNDIICKANQDCMLSLTEKVGYLVAISYTQDHEPSEHDTQTTTDNIKINIHPEDKTLTLQYVNKIQELNHMGAVAVKSQNNATTQFNLDNKVTNITYVIGQTFAYQDTQNTGYNINPFNFKEPKITKKYITLSIQKYEN